ncbi:MAG: hypothetical protein ACI4V5_04035, partial [Prevotella sp.]
MYNTLQQGGYQKSYEEFEKSFVGNENYGYRRKVYDAIKQNVGGVGDSYDDFFKSLQSPSESSASGDMGAGVGASVVGATQRMNDDTQRPDRSAVVNEVNSGSSTRSEGTSNVLQPFSSAEYAQLSAVGKEVAEGVGLYSEDIAERERVFKEETAAADKREEARQMAAKERNAKLEEEQRKAYNDAVIADAYNTHDDYKPFSVGNGADAPYIDVRTKQYTDKLVNELYAEARKRKDMLTSRPETPKQAELSSAGYNSYTRYDDIEEADDPERLKDEALKRIKADEWNIKQEAAKWANDNQGKAGDEVIDVNQFAEYVYERTIADALGKIDAVSVEKAKPKEDAEFVLRGIEDSMAGSIISMMTTTPAKAKARMRASEEYGSDASMLTNVARGTMSFATDAGTGSFAISGKLSESAVSQLVKNQLRGWIDRGLSEAAAMRMLQSSLYKKFGKGFGDRLLKNALSGSVNLGSYESMKTLSRQASLREYDFDEVTRAALSGAVGGGALGFTGSTWGEITKNLKGFPKILSNVAGLGIEAGTFTATGELEKWATGHSDEIRWSRDFLENVAMVVGMKLSSPSSARHLFSTRKQEEAYMPYMLSDTELSDMKATKEGYRLWRAVMQDGQGEEHIQSCYKDFMINSDCDFATKQKMSLGLYGVMIRNTPHVHSYERKEGVDGDIVVTTLSQRGQRIESVHFDDRGKADAYCEKLTEAIIQGDATSVNIESWRIASEMLRREYGLSDEQWGELLADGESEESVRARAALMRKWHELTTEYSFGEGKIEASTGSDEGPLTDDEVTVITDAMKANATVAPYVEINDENWRESVKTPIGTVKLGENQKSKLFAKGREHQYGMLLETLSAPDLVLEEKDKGEDNTHERPSSYLFVKTFQKEDGSKFVHFESVTISRNGMEISISSHIIRENQLKNKLKSDRLLYKATALDVSANTSAEQPIVGGSHSSAGKVSENVANGQGDVENVGGNGGLQIRSNVPHGLQIPADGENENGNGNGGLQTRSDVTQGAGDPREQGSTDNQGNPINEDGSLKLDKITSVDELTDEDFSAPTRNVELPTLPKNVDNAIGANGKPVIIKKNIFEKNKISHKDLSAEDSKMILSDVLYNPNLYGQNQKATRPYNWILVHLADKNEAVIVEVNNNKDNIEIVNWHYLNGEALERKKRQAEKEGGQILTLESAAANTLNDSSSAAKVVDNFENASVVGEKVDSGVINENEN